MSENTLYDCLFVCFYRGSRRNKQALTAGVMWFEVPETEPLDLSKSTDVPTKKMRKTKHLRGRPPPRSLHQRKGGKRITEDSDEEDNSSVPELSKLPATDIRKPFQRRPWSDKEKAAVWRQLGKSIILKKVPGKQLCLNAIQAEPVLCQRTWKDVKYHVYNRIAIEKRKN
ncbi:uncharacterized protein LOC130520465 [Takifugu flavidus]|uniref:uncharacterized protein LOC130520465 n=1 Tax=Takifugu flavidus TaxID=433684 RepID=UPI0025441E05|nr:uncharacterized protein LOC130520465 [Takifugu flavidus]